MSMSEYFNIFLYICVIIIFISIIAIFIVIVLCRSQVNIALNCNKTNTLEYYTVRSTCKRIYDEYFNTIQNFQLTIIIISVLYFIALFIRLFFTTKLHSIPSFLFVIFVIFISILLMYFIKPDNTNIIAKQRYENFRKEFNSFIDTDTGTDIGNMLIDNIKNNIKYIHDVVDADFLYEKEKKSENLLDYISTHNINIKSLLIFQKFKDFIKNSRIDVEHYQDDPNYKVMRYYIDRLYGSYISNDFHIIDIISILIIIFIYLILIQIIHISNINYLTLFIIIFSLIISCIYFSDVIIKVRK